MLINIETNLNLLWVNRIELLNMFCSFLDVYDSINNKEKELITQILYFKVFMLFKLMYNFN